MAYQWRDRLSANRPRPQRVEMRVFAVAVVAVVIVWLLFGERSPLFRFFQALQ